MDIVWELKMYVFVIILLSASVTCQAAYEGINEGDMCLDYKNVIGNCTVLQECKQALLDIKWNKKLQYCKSKIPDVLVCCILDSFEYLSSLENIDDCKFQYGRRCEKTQRKSHDACLEYQEMVCPQPKPGDIIDNIPVISYGVDSEEGQFPYLALLGFGNNTSSATWQCGGSIVSKNFILTAGHCTGGPGIGPVTFAVVGTLRRSDPIKEARLYKVKRIIKHPDYRPPHKYNDIALLEMETPITFDRLVQPACLYDKSARGDDVATIAGWGATFYKGEGADVLQHHWPYSTGMVLHTNFAEYVKVTVELRVGTIEYLANVRPKRHLSITCDNFTFSNPSRPPIIGGEVRGVGICGSHGRFHSTWVNKFSDEECSKLYSPSRLLKQGFNSSTQLCYGHYEMPKDTCQGDSGGPLESTNYNFLCIRTVVGVTSFGKSCGHTGVPGIYTRVAAFLPWIESVVWP